MPSTQDVSSGAGRRLSGVERRAQLLDVAAELLAEGGFGLVTMERIALRAGVSKALPYRHFANSSELLATLADREMQTLGRRLVAALEAAPAPDRVDALVHGFFSAVRDRAVVLALVESTGSPVPTPEERTPALGPRFAADLLVRYFALERDRARELSGALVGFMRGAVRTWLSGAASRRAVEATATAFLRAGLRAARSARQA